MRLKKMLHWSGLRLILSLLTKCLVKKWWKSHGSLLWIRVQIWAVKEWPGKHFIAVLYETLIWRTLLELCGIEKISQRVILLLGLWFKLGYEALIFLYFSGCLLFQSFEVNLDLSQIWHVSQFLEKTSVNFSCDFFLIVKFFLAFLKPLTINDLVDIKAF